MGIFDRFSKVIKSNANAAVDKLGDPSKQVEQLVIEMEEALRKARGETTQSMASSRLAAARVPEAQRRIGDWQRRAELAASSGDEGLAREALEQQRAAQEELRQVQREAAEAATTADAQQTALRTLEAKLREVKLRKGTIKAKLASGRNQDLASGSLDDFDRMAGRVDQSEDRLEAERELAGALDSGARDAETNAKLDRLKGGDLDERLAALKKKIEK